MAVESVSRRFVIEGKVAKLLNEEELAINRGSDQGVAEGMTFWVMDDTTQHILDPDTGEDLGGIPRAKVRLKITTVGRKAAVAERYPPETIADFLASYSAQAARSKGRQSPDKWPEGVQIGDSVRSDWIDVTTK